MAKKKEEKADATKEEGKKPSGYTYGRTATIIPRFRGFCPNC